MATGMLPICLDEATKVIAEIESGAKAYEFTLQLGSRTDTGDAEGRIVETTGVPVLDANTVEGVLAGFRGVQTQVPPMYSALKRGGRPLYELARQGLEVDRPPRSIDIRRLELLEYGREALRLACECAKGTYIRVLGEDIARALGTLGHLTSLRRSWVEPFRDMPMRGLEQVLADAPQGLGLLRPDEALKALPEARTTIEQAIALRHGQVVSAACQPLAAPGRRVRLYGPDGDFLGLGEVLSDGRLQPRRLLAAGDR
jgi:tRNA pseudouridine55 synthase